MLDEPLTSDETAALSPDVGEDVERRLSHEEVQWLMHGSRPSGPLGIVSDGDTYSATPEHGPPPRNGAPRAFEFRELRSAGTKPGASRDAREVELRVELGRRPISTEEAASLGVGEVVSLEDSSRLVSLYDGERFVATAELLIEDERLCVRVVELPGDAFLGIKARGF